MGRCIVITSGKGGVGKTTVTATLGTALALCGSKVVVVDADVGLNNLDMVLGLEGSVVYDVLDVQRGRCRLGQALVADPYVKGLYVLSSRAMCGTELTMETFRGVIQSLRETNDYVLVDCPAGIDEGFHRAVSCAEEAIIVTTPTPTAVRDADKVVNLLSNYSLRRVSLIVNRVRGDLVIRGDIMSVGDISEVLRLPVIGSVPEDDDVLLSATVGKVGDCDSGHYRSICMIADNLMRGTGKIYDCTSMYRGIRGFFRLLAK